MATGLRHGGWGRYRQRGCFLCNARASSSIGVKVAIGSAAAISNGHCNCSSLIKNRRPIFALQLNNFWLILMVKSHNRGQQNVWNWRNILQCEWLGRFWNLRRQLSRWIRYSKSDPDPVRAQVSMSSTKRQIRSKGQVKDLCWRHSRYNLKGSWNQLFTI